MSLFITFEGPEGSGKSTQMQLLAEYLEECGYSVLTTREPGGTSIGEKIRDVLLSPENQEMSPLTEVLLYSAARAQHIEQVIPSHLEDGCIVLCDRYADSTLAYQGYGHGLDLTMLRTITEFATGGLKPDLTVYLDLLVEVGLKRRLRPQRERILLLREIEENSHITQAELASKLSVSEKKVNEDLKDLIAKGYMIRMERIGRKWKYPLTSRGKQFLYEAGIQLPLFEKWDRFDTKGLEFHRRVRGGYQKLAAAEPERWLVVDANRSIEEVRKEIIVKVTEILKAIS